jgi:cupin 2 domain-containing protein
MTPPLNLFADVPTELPEELVQILLNCATVRIERIISRGHKSPDGFWYDQETSEWVLLLDGAARLRIAGADDLVQLSPGSFINLPAHTRHRVEWTEPNQPTIWLAIHY